MGESKFNEIIGGSVLQNPTTVNVVSTEKKVVKPKRNGDEDLLKKLQKKDLETIAQGKSGINKPI